MQMKSVVLAGADWALFQRAYHQDKMTTATDDSQILLF